MRSTVVSIALKPGISDKPRIGVREFAMSKLLLLALMGALAGAGCTEETHYQSIADAIKRIDKENLRTHVEILTQAGARSPDNKEAINQAVRYIKSMLSEYGYQPIEETLGSHITGEENSYPFINIIAERRGTGEPLRILELVTFAPEDLETSLRMQQKTMCRNFRISVPIEWVAFSKTLCAVITSPIGTMAIALSC